MAPSCSGAEAQRRFARSVADLDLPNVKRLHRCGPPHCLGPDIGLQRPDFGNDEGLLDVQDEIAVRMSSYSPVRHRRCGSIRRRPIVVEPVSVYTRRNSTLPLFVRPEQGVAHGLARCRAGRN